MEFKPRPLSPQLEENTTPAEQMAKLLRRKRAQEEKLLAQLDAQRKQHLEVLTELALDIHRKRHFEYAASFRTLSAILEKAGVVVKTYEGEPLNDEMRETLNIVQWLPADGNPADRVAEAFEPEIGVCGTLTHRAKLICREGGEAAESPAPAAVVPAESPAAASAAPENPSAPPAKPPAKKKGSVSRKKQKNKKKAKK